MHFLDRYDEYVKKAIWAFNAKLEGYGLAERLNIPTPLTHLIVPDLDQLYHVLEWAEKEGQKGRGVARVIKPNHGSSSRGVLVLERDLSFPMRGIGPRTAKEWIEHLRHVEGKYVNPPWIVEERIPGFRNEWPGDLKVFTVGGRAQFLQRNTIRPGGKWNDYFHTFWDRSGTSLHEGIIQIGGRENRLDQPSSYHKQAIQWAERVAAELHSPFVRVDFLEGRDGLVFNEITPRPGPMNERSMFIGERLSQQMLDAWEIWDAR